MIGLKLQSCFINIMIPLKKYLEGRKNVENAGTASSTQTSKRGDGIKRKMLSS